MSDREIIDALNRHNHRENNSAMDALYQSAFPSVSTYVTKNNGSVEEAHDVFQDALVVFYMKIRRGDFQPASSLNTYLYAISKNLWLKQLRRKKAIKKQAPDSVLYEFPEEMVLHENQVTVRKVLELIDSECRQLLLDFYFESKPVKELKVIYKLGSDAATKNKKYRCLQKLVALVKQKKWGREDFLND